ncbi:MAG: NTP transferase domain-containing protein [Planctomycetota bacterium]|jgi:bifunctional UDP-N-acetylglucosamine pyrophosphorylase/glucosamine-1-phosphate N-acetyltransferase|nr:NTP transferase domain-containing protein [Planctomycetota bacterium]
MSYDAVSAVILAAGKGTRMGSDKAKVLHELAGKPMVLHVLDTCRAVGIGQQVVVVGHQREAVEQVVAGDDVSCVLQDQQLGTGHAVLVTESAVRGDTVVVLCGDAPLVPVSLLTALLERHAASGAACTAVAARMADPSGYGRMVTDEAGNLVRIVEHKDASDEELAINLINSGIYAFDRAELFRCLRSVRPDNSQGEYYLTDVPKMLVEEGRTVPMVVSEDPGAVLGVNTPAHLAEAERLYAAR